MRRLVDSCSLQDPKLESAQENSTAKSKSSPAPTTMNQREAPNSLHQTESSLSSSSSMLQENCRLQVSRLSIQESDPQQLTRTKFEQEASKARRSKRDKRDSRHKKVQEAAAETAAIYYSQCYVEGVGGTTADRAAQESHDKYRKWWLQDFDHQNKSGIVSSVGDAHVVPRFNPPHKIPPIDNKDGEQQQETNDQEQKLKSVVDDSKEKVVHSTNNDNSTLPIPTETYYTVTDYEYDNDDMGYKIGGSANAAAMATMENNIHMNISSEQSTPHTNNCVARRQVYTESTTYKGKSIVQHDANTEGLACSRAKNPSPVRLKNDDSIDNMLRLTTKQASYSSRKKRLRQKSQDYNNLTEFFSLQPPVRNQEVDEAFLKAKSKRSDIQRRGSTNSDYDENGFPRRSSSSFFHEVSEKARKFSNANAKNAVWDEFVPASSIDDTPLPTSDEKYSAILTSRGTPSERRAKHLDNAKLGLLHALAVSSGDVTSQPFLFALEQLRTLYNSTEWDARFNRSPYSQSEKTIEGMWLSLSRPNFNECIGKNSAGEYMYTLGRMSFDMFAPGNLVCSIQGMFNHIQVVDLEKDCYTLKSVPKSLKDEISKGESILRKYDIVTAFSIEPDSPQFGHSSPNKCVQKALRGIITTYGYVLPDPSTPNRLSIWFSGGKIEPNEEDNNLVEWRRAFGGGLLKRHLQEKARLLAAKLLLGAETAEKIEEDGSMMFHLHRPIGGHGSAYVDVLYLDNTLRIVQGHRGSLFVFSRVS